MNIYEKLTKMQNDLLEIPIKKSGKNSFGGFNYYELDDLLPPILKLCNEYGCTLYFDFPSDVNGECNKGVLHLVNWEDKEDNIKVQVPFPQLEKLPKMNYAQSSGTYQTYMKRYLILHTFDIVESELIDAMEMEKPQKKNGTNKKSAPKKNSSPQQEEIDLEALIEKIQFKAEELYPEEEFNKAVLNKTSMGMFRKKEISAEERKAIMEYVKTL